MPIQFQTPPQSLSDLSKVEPQLCSLIIYKMTSQTCNMWHSHTCGNLFLTCFHCALSLKFIKRKSCKPKNDCYYVNEQTNTSNYLFRKIYYGSTGVLVMPVGLLLIFLGQWGFNSWRVGSVRLVAMDPWLQDLLLWPSKLQALQCWLPSPFFTLGSPVLVDSEDDWSDWLFSFMALGHELLRGELEVPISSLGEIVVMNCTGLCHTSHPSRFRDTF